MDLCSMLQFCEVKKSYGNRQVLSIPPLELDKGILLFVLPLKMCDFLKLTLVIFGIVYFSVLAGALFLLSGFF
ncbi:hypothetical protein ACX0G9_24625 [Flavitalea flava]